MAKFIYQTHCAAIISAVEDGTLKHGDKLDSVRQFARKRGIGVSTAVQVYQTLERQGWVKAVPKSGYYVHRPTSPPSPSYGNRFVSSRDLTQLPLATAVQFSLSLPEVLPLSCTAPGSVVDTESLVNTLHRKALRSRPYRQLNHDPHETTKPLRKAIAKHLLGSGQSIHHDQLLITNGRNEGLTIALGACGLMHSRVAIESPCSFYFQAILQHYQMTTVAVPQQADLDDELALLQQAYEQEPFAAYLFNPNFNDPTGRVLSDDDKRRLIAWAEHNSVVLIEYDRGELYFGNHRPVSTAALVQDDSKVKLVSITDFYDTVSDRFGLGYLLCINTFAECEASQRMVAEMPPIASLMMMQALFESGRYSRLVNQVRAHLARQCHQMLEILSAALTQPIASGELYISHPQGGPCLWIGLPQGKSATELWQQLIEKKVAIAPGCLFMSDAWTDRFFRVTFGLPWNEQMEQGVQQLADTLKSFIDPSSA